jgi:hypothetical protein
MRWDDVFFCYEVLFSLSCFCFFVFLLFLGEMLICEWIQHKGARTPLVGHKRAGTWRRKAELLLSLSDE